jgi:hypothetical protein
MFQSLQVPPARSLIYANLASVTSNDEQFSARRERELEWAIVNYWLMTLMGTCQTQRGEVVSVNSIQEIGHRESFLMWANSGKATTDLSTDRSKFETFTGLTFWFEPGAST